MSVRHRVSNLRRQPGVGLIEVLVTVLVLSIGLLGVASLQMTGLKAVHDASIRTQVIPRIGGMLDRIRANLPGFRAGNYTSANAAGVTSVSCTDCSPAELAANDIAQWYASFAEGNVPLATGASKVTLTCNGPASCGMGSVLAITVTWQDRDLDGSAVEKVYTLRTVM